MKIITGILHEYLCNFMIISRYILLRMINIWTKVVANQYTFYVQYHFSYNRATLEIVWKNMVQKDTPHMTI